MDSSIVEQENARIYEELHLTPSSLSDPRSVKREASALQHVVTVARRTTTGFTRGTLRSQNIPPRMLIRLLILQHGSGPEPLECDLQVSDLHDLPVYDALSYVWGDSQSPCSIKCCGKPFSIRRNLHSALKHLRNSDRDRVLWADAICINQHDPYERADQVSFMGRIYAHARHVLIWLGDRSHQEDSQAFETIVALKNELPHGYLNYSRYTTKLRSSLLPITELRGSEVSQVKEKYRTILDQLRFRHLLHFFSRPWFKRVWVIQEVVKATHQPIVLCGKDQLSWDDFEKVVLTFNGAISWLMEKYGNRTSPQLRVSAIENLENLPAMTSLRKHHKEMSLFNILCIASAFESTDERDKLFALLSLGDASNLEVQPDYTSPYFEVFRRFAIHELLERHRLHYLARPPRVWRPDWPSWIPDWTEVSRSSYFYTAMNHSFKAAADTQPKLAISKDESTLIIRGRVVDSLAKLVTSLDRSSVLQPFEDAISTDGSRQYAALHEWLEECLGIDNLEVKLINDYPTRRIEPLLRTLACKGVRDGPKEAELRRILGELAAARIQKRSSIASDQAETTDDENDLVALPIISLAAKLYPAIADRQFLKTKGNRLGWVSRRAEEGDAVCILNGGDVPFVIRRIDTSGESASTGYDGGNPTYWRMIGECYVDGLMKGETMEATGIQEMTFQIR